MAGMLASIDLVLLVLVALSVALTFTPVPRPWAAAAAVLLTVQTLAIHQMELQPTRPGVPQSGALVHTAAEAVAVLAIPALTSMLLIVVFFYCARAYAQARRRLADALRRGQAIGSDMPTG